jgi:DNA-binding XRE family transcriptional regulator
MSAHRTRRGAQHHRLRLPDATAGLNHSILSGTLIDSPRLGRNPVGEPVALLRVEFPVVDPERPQTLWAWGSCEVEVSDALANRHGILALEGGAPILAAGQLSERWAISDGRTSKRATIVAALVRLGPPPGCDELLIPRWSAMTVQAVIDIAAQFGDNLARCRRLAGISQDELSVRASVHRTEISQIERGLRIPQIGTLAKLTASLDVSSDELMEGIAWQSGDVRRGHFVRPERTVG